MGTQNHANDQGGCHQAKEVRDKDDQQTAKRKLNQTPERPPTAYAKAMHSLTCKALFQCKIVQFQVSRVIRTTDDAIAIAGSLLLHRLEVLLHEGLEGGCGFGNLGLRFFSFVLDALVDVLDKLEPLFEIQTSLQRREGELLRNSLQRHRATDVHCVLTFSS